MSQTHGHCIPTLILFVYSEPVKLLMFADDSTLFSVREKWAYRSETDLLVSLCSMNKFELNALSADDSGFEEGS